MVEGLIIFALTFTVLLLAGKILCLLWQAIPTKYGLQLFVIFFITYLLTKVTNIELIKILAFAYLASIFILWAFTSLLSIIGSRIRQK